MDKVVFAHFEDEDDIIISLSCDENSELAVKGETADELCGAAEVMRDKVVRVNVPGSTMCTCGTGGSGLSTSNTGTMNAFVLAAGGSSHGTRSL
jgi:anthranilate phosphoribosyltransferase